MKSTPALPRISKTKQMYEIEERTGRDIRQILIEAYNRLGSQAAVAKELGVTQPTIDAWLDMLGIITVTKTEAMLKDPASNRALTA